MFGKKFNPDYTLIALIVSLVIVGLLVLTSASSDLGKIKYNDSYYYLKHQLFSGLSVGLLGFLAALSIPYEKYRKFAFPLFLVSVAMLAMVFTPLGLHVRNASRWIQIGPVNFQPSELIKLTFIIYLSAWLTQRGANRSRSIEGFLPFLIISGTVGLLLVLQPATSTVAILMISGLAVYFASGAKWRYLAGLILGGFLVLVVLVWLTPYRMQRVKTYLNISADTEGHGYHINQALITIGSGGLTGVGFGQSTSKVNYLPAPIDDSIFAVAAAEFGFLGASLIVVLYAGLVLRLFFLAYKAKEQFARLTLTGFGSIIGLQSIVHISSNSGLLPLTGVPLPFMSYGGTALAVFMVVSGVVINISGRIR